MPKKSDKKISGKSEGKTEKAEKIKLSQEEFEKRVIELANQGLTSEKIGEKLRGMGIHPMEYKKRISEIMGEKYVPPELINVQAKLDNLHKHIEKNKQDKRAVREKDRIFSQLRKLKEFFGQQ